MPERTADNINPNILEHEVNSALRRSGPYETNPYLLPGTGFNVRLQVGQLERDLKSEILDGRTFLESFDRNFQKVEQDIQGFKVEYLCEGLVFPIVLDKKTVGGRKRVVAPLYNDKPLVDTISQQERNGAVKQSLRRVEEFLLNAPAGSIAVLTSPPGWSGFEAISYQDSQTYIWQVKQDGNLRGFTIRTDMDLGQNRELLVGLGIDPEKLQGQTTQDQLTAIAQNPVLISAQNGQAWQIEDAVDAIRYIKKSDLAYMSKPFSEIYENLKNPEHLFAIDETTQKLVRELKDYCFLQLLQTGFNSKALEVALGLTILKLASAIRGNSTTSQIIKPDNAYRAVLADLQTLPGCNGGGNKNSIFSGTITPRLLDSSSLEDHSDFSCPRCGETITYGSGVTKCPTCHLEATCG